MSRGAEDFTIEIPEDQPIVLAATLAERLNDVFTPPGKTGNQTLHRTACFVLECFVLELTKFSKPDTISISIQNQQVKK